MSRTISVGLGERAYDVLVGEGLLDAAGRLIAPFARHGRVAVVTDYKLSDLYIPSLLRSLGETDLEASVLAIPPGEETKSFTWLESVTDFLLQQQLDRGDLVVAFGGGVVGDLAGFAAAIYKRGIDFVQVPTTLLAQVDSSVGGKTAIDTPHGKNLVGAFHQPRLVLADLAVLQTLPEREMRCGYAEVIKYGLLGDLGFFEWLEANGPAVLAGDTAALSYAVARSVEMKAEIVAEDEREQGRRALLNLGHTFAHALEAETGYGETLKHGEAVGVGMALAFRFSAREGHCSGQDAGRAAAAIAAAGLPTALADLPGHPFDAARLVAHMAQDKKAEGGRLTFILARALGDAFVARDVDAAVVTRFLLSEGARP